MGKLHFKATEIENDVNDYGVLVVGFHSADHYVTIQLDESDEEDENPGMNTYHIERDDQSFGNYGGVEQVILTKGQIKVIPNAKGKKFLKCTEIVAKFDLSNAKLAKLKKNLAAIFKDAFEFA